MTQEQARALAITILADPARGTYAERLAQVEALLNSADRLANARNAR